MLKLSDKKKEKTQAILFITASLVENNKRDGYTPKNTLNTSFKYSLVHDTRLDIVGGLKDRRPRFIIPLFLINLFRNK